MRGLLKLKDRPALCIVVITLTVGVLGTIFSSGIDFLVTPLPVPRRVAMMGLLVNMILAAGAMVMVYRNLHRFEPRWTWQERGFSRGVFLLLFAGVLGYLGRTFSVPTVTLGTPVYSIGLLYIIWASVRNPERFETEDRDGRTS